MLRFFTLSVAALSVCSIAFAAPKTAGAKESTCEKGIGNHTPQFADASGSERADELTAPGATVLAWTAADVLLRPEVRDRLAESFREQMGREPAK